MIRNNKKIAVLLWLYHTDLTLEFLQLLQNTEDIFDIYVGLYNNKSNHKSIAYLNTLNNIKSINFYPNVGADIYSFTDQIQAIDESQYDYFIKIHSKKSKWGVNKQCNWRAMLLDSLLSNRFTINRNLKLMQKYNYGILCCRPLIYENSEYTHEKKISEILNYMNYSPVVRKFAGGNMFMGNLSLFKKYLSGYYDYIKNLLEQERGKINERKEGTYSHAMERILGYIGSEYGMGGCITKNINLKILDKNLDYDSLSFRIMYNNEIYCTKQPSLYGKVNVFDHDMMSVVWLKTTGNIMAKYARISTNTYINQNYLH